MIMIFHQNFQSIITTTDCIITCLYIIRIIQLPKKRLWRLRKMEKLPEGRLFSITSSGSHVYAPTVTAATVSTVAAEFVGRRSCDCAEMFKLFPRDQERGILRQRVSECVHTWTERNWHSGDTAHAGTWRTWSYQWTCFAADIGQQEGMRPVLGSEVALICPDHRVKSSWNNHEGGNLSCNSFA